jgi:spermidine/putrescine transport system ATP-binding protein
VALARALAPRPKVLLLDEPLSALDYKLRKDMQIELKRMQHETGITFVFVTHDQEEALTMSDRIAVMNRGKVLQIGSPRAIYGEPADRFVASFIGETNFMPCAIVRDQLGGSAARLKDGSILSVNGAGYLEPGDATLSIRPEQARITMAPEPGTLRATVETVIFIGSGIQVHTRLSDGSPFIVRQNDLCSGEKIETGQRVSIAVSDGAARLLRN